MLVAAFAMLAFAGCQKENNVATQNGMVNFGVSGETPADQIKEAFNGTQSAIFFTNDDQIWINDSLCGVYPLRSNVANTNSTWSDKARVSARLADTYLFTYPANTYTKDEDDYWTCTFAENVVLQSNNGRPENRVTSANQIWPMSYYIANLSDLPYDVVNGCYVIRVQNNVNVMAPAIKYGVPFGNAMWRANSTENTYTDPEDLPSLFVTKFVVKSNDVKLTGAARLMNAETNNPYVAMVNDPVEGDMIVATVNNVEVTGSNDVATIIGNLPIAPYADAMPLNSTVTFTFALYFNVDVDGTVHYYKYENTARVRTDDGEREFTTGIGHRGYRNMILANMNVSTDMQEMLSHVTELDVNGQPLAE